jgi:hypothetical protein
MIKETKFNYKKYYSNKNLLSINQDSKTVKGTKKGYLTGILYLAPHKNDRNNFMLDLYKSITKLIKKADNLNLIPVVRLNGTSDLRWENIRFNYNGKHKTIFQAFPTVQFYDYTKFELNTKRWDNLPSNYDLTFSLSEENSLAAYELLLSGQRVAMVYRDKLPSKQIFKSKDLMTEFNVINADETDLRFKDGKGLICGLIAKGSGKQDATGFVKDNNIINI